MMMCADVLVLVLFLVQSDCKLIEESHCSKYDFQEKVLEKMVRTEYQMEITKSEMENCVSKVEKLKKDVRVSLATVDEKLKTVAEYLEEVSGVEAKLQNTLHTLVAKFEELQNQTSERFDEKFEKLREAVLTPTVAFKARLKKSKSVTRGATIVFPNVLFNEGQAYSPSTGIFTTPVSGTYLFTTSFCLMYKKYLVVGIMVDSVRYTAALSHGDDNNECNTADTVVVLKAGQKVWVEASRCDSTGIIIDQTDSFRWNTFSGTLIHK